MQDIQKTTSPDKESYLKELCTPDYLMHIHKLIKILILQTCKKHNTHRNSFYLLTPETEHGTHTKDGSISAVNSHVCNIYLYISLQINIYSQGRLLMRLCCGEDIQLLQATFIF